MKKLLSLLLCFVMSWSTFVSFSNAVVKAEEELSNEDELLYSGEGVILDEESTNDVFDGCVSYANLPSSVDLSESIYFPPIDNQGEINSCSAWATTYYQFGYQIAKKNNWNAKEDVN